VIEEVYQPSKTGFGLAKVPFTMKSAIRLDGFARVASRQSATEWTSSMPSVAFWLHRDFFGSAVKILIKVGGNTGGNFKDERTYATVFNSLLSTFESHWLHQIRLKILAISRRSRRRSLSFHLFCTALACCECPSPSSMRGGHSAQVPPAAPIVFLRFFGSKDNIRLFLTPSFPVSVERQGAPMRDCRERGR
jgi:hypothetical protein